MTRLICIVCCVALLVGTTGAALAETYTFTGSEDSTWDEQGNWTPSGGPPGLDDKAIIPPAYACTTNGVDVGCKILVVQADTSPDYVPGYLYITQDSTFTLYGDESEDSVIDGQLYLISRQGGTDPGELLIYNDLTITGIGAFGTNAFDSDPQGKIISRLVNDEPTTLTIESGADIAGKNLEVQAKLVNNAMVLARGLNETLSLTTHPKSGSGVWAADSYATLHVDVEVSGGGTWNLCPDGATDGTIRVTEDCTGLTGDVLIGDGGTLQVEATFCTTGDIDFFGGAITIPSGYASASADFGGTCP
jgi:hypothetical protein